MSIEVISGSAPNFLPLIAFCAGLTAIAFIAIVLFLDIHPDEEPVQLPTRGND